MASSVFSPKPFRSRILCAWQACAELVERGDVQLMEELRGPFRSQARHAEDGQHAFGHLGQQFLEHGQRAGRDQRGDFFGQVLADPLEPIERLLGISHDVGDRLGQVVDGPGGVAIGADPERVRPLKLQQVGDLFKDGGDFVVGHGTAAMWRRMNDDA